MSVISGNGPTSTQGCISPILNIASSSHVDIPSQPSRPLTWSCMLFSWPPFSASYVNYHLALELAIDGSLKACISLHTPKGKQKMLFWDCLAFNMLLMLGCTYPCELSKRAKWLPHNPVGTGEAMNFTIPKKNPSTNTIGAKNEKLHSYSSLPCFDSPFKFRQI